MSGQNSWETWKDPVKSSEEKERMYALLWETDRPNAPRWSAIHPDTIGVMRAVYDRRLAAFPQLWDSLPPDPAEQARREAEEDRRTVEAWRGIAADNGMPLFAREWARDAVALIDRMAARAKAGHMVLADREGE